MRKLGRIAALTIKVWLSVGVMLKLISAVASISIAWLINSKKTAVYFRTGFDDWIYYYQSQILQAVLHAAKIDRRPEWKRLLQICVR